MIIRWKKVVIYLWLSPIWIFVWCKRCSFSVQTRKGVTPADQKVTQVLRQDCRPCIRNHFGKCFHITNCNFCFNFLNGFQKKKDGQKIIRLFFVQILVQNYVEKSLAAGTSSFCELIMKYCSTSFILTPITDNGYRYILVKLNQHFFFNGNVICENDLVKKEKPNETYFVQKFPLCSKIILSGGKTHIFFQWHRNK